MSTFANAPASRCPNGVANHFNGCTCVKRGGAADGPGGREANLGTDGVDLLHAPVAPTVEDLTSRFRPEIDALEKRWREEADTEGVFNGLILALGDRVLEAAEEDRPGYDRLAEALDTLAEDRGDDDAAEEVIYCLQDITDREKMKVAEDGNGGHVRLYDGKPGATCPDCGNGYATSAALLTHREQDCDGAIDAEDAAMDEDAHDALHSAAESFASEINNAGRREQVGFLRRMGVPDDQILAAFEDAADAGDPDSLDRALDDLVIDVASETASQAYNDGESDGSAVTATLEGKRWMTTGDFAVRANLYWPSALRDGEAADFAYQSTINGVPTKIPVRIAYIDEVPNGDDGTPARGYLRGEYRAEAEWAAFSLPAARKTAPFRPDRGEGAAERDYAIDEFMREVGSSVQAEIEKRYKDPIERFIAGS